MEATNARGEEFGLHRIQNILEGSSSLQAQAIVDAVMAANQDFVASNLSQVDDRTILVIRVE